jgi:predicted anti-sigma-YlaC factor YlaD
MWQGKDRRDVTQACKEYEARLEDLLSRREDAAADAELEAHLKRCAACREALEDARLASELLHAGLRPAPELSGAFATRVMAGVRAEEFKRQQFWRPLEVLASRLALTAVTALLVLSVYVYEFAAPVHREPVTTSQSPVAEGLPAAVRQPADKDEILLSLAEGNHGR